MHERPNEPHPEAPTIDVLVGERLKTLGISRGELARRLSLRNVSKALRRLDQLCEGDFDHTKELIERLPAGLDLPAEQVRASIDATRTHFELLRKQEAEDEEVAWRARFEPHAILVTERSRPEPIFVAAILGVERILRIDFDLTQRRASFAQQALAKLPKAVPAFNRVIGFVVNYAPDRAIRYDLEGKAIELLRKAVRPGKATLLMGKKPVDLSTLSDRR